MARSQVDFRLDPDGVREVLQSTEVRAMVDEAAGKVADHVRAGIKAPEAVQVDAYTTDRQAARVTIADIRGMAWQARDGVLTRAATAAGAEVKERRR